MFTVGPLSTNCYIVGCKETQEAIIIDPGFDEPSEAEKIFKVMDKNCMKLKFIVNTHGHPDHTCGNGLMKNKFNTAIAIHKNDTLLIGPLSRLNAENFGFSNFSPPADLLLQEGDLTTFGKETLKVIETPGHPRGSISLIEEDKIFTGDTLFAGSIGRTDFSESSEKEMKLSLEKLKTMHDSLTVYQVTDQQQNSERRKLTTPFSQDSSEKIVPIRDFQGTYFALFTGFNRT
jgi:glyoxylase-like metal-dependent hydrolase (beta-lactamase superfamily II)